MCSKEQKKKHKKETSPGAKNSGANTHLNACMLFGLARVQKAALMHLGNGYLNGFGNNMYARVQQKGPALPDAESQYFILTLIVDG